jgi:rubrerythrin
MERDQWMTEVVKRLNHLIQLDFDAAGTYHQALGHCDDTAARTDLMSFLVDHERHITNTMRVIRELGGTPIDVHRDFKGAVLEGMTKLRSYSGTLGALRAMRMNEKITNRTYDRSANIYMPPLAVALVLEGLADERKHLTTIEMHIDRLARRGATIPVDQVGLRT